MPAGIPSLGHREMPTIQHAVASVAGKDRGEMVLGLQRTSVIPIFYKFIKHISVVIYVHFWAFCASPTTITIIYPMLSLKYRDLEQNLKSALDDLNPGTPGRS